MSDTIATVKQEVSEAVVEINQVVAEVDTVAEALDAVHQVETIIAETLVDLSGTPIPALLQTLVAQVSEFSSQSTILRFVAPLAAAVHGMTVPGPQKKALVLKALHEFTAELEKAGKLTPEMKESVDIFIDGAGPVAIDAILDVAKGKVDFTTEQATQMVVSVAGAGCAACFAYLFKPKPVAK
jgi:hypothetical protein